MHTKLKKLIRERREALGLTQADLARYLGVQPEFICLIEGGRRRPDLDRLPRLAEVLDLDAGRLCRLAIYERAPRCYAALFGIP